MTQAVLHYVHDPLCGWCWGAAPLVKAARALLLVRAHGGGLMAGARRQRVTPQLRDFVLPHDRRIAQLSGQPFGVDYTDGLLRDDAAVFDSEPPIAALLAAERVAGQGAPHAANAGLDLLARLQAAHYLQGRRIAEPAVLQALAVEQGLPAAAFAMALAQQLGAPVQAHIAQTRALMQRWGVQGFPGLVLEEQGRFERLDTGRWMGQPQAFAAWLTQRLKPQTAPLPASPDATAAAGLQCGPEACER